jgi:hypothetical protein
MWQKINQLDVVKLEKARIQIINCLQLVCAPPRIYSNKKSDALVDWLHWDQKSNSFVSNKFGKKQSLYITLDIEQFILSIHGAKNKKEHLVLSGMTYPMAYGWMNIKLETFEIDSSKFDDKATYEIEGQLRPEAELNADDPLISNQIVLHYCNAHQLLHDLLDQKLVLGKVLIDPANANMTLLSNDNALRCGFSLGCRSFPEPYFFIQIQKSSSALLQKNDELQGLWNNAKKEVILMASDYVTHNQDQEYQNVHEFFRSNLGLISDLTK